MTTEKLCSMLILTSLKKLSHLLARPLGQVSDTFALFSCIFEANLLAFFAASTRSMMKSFRLDFREGFRLSICGALGGKRQKEKRQTFQSLLDYLGRWESHTAEFIRVWRGSERDGMNNNFKFSRRNPRHSHRMTSSEELKRSRKHVADLTGRGTRHPEATEGFQILIFRHSSSFEAVQM